LWAGNKQEQKGERGFLFELVTGEDFGSNIAKLLNLESSMGKQ
jgi:hypothetical protein